MTVVEPRRPLIGDALPRSESREKVTGAARYAFEMLGERHALVAWPVQSTDAPGRIRSIDVADALAVPGVVDVLTHETAPRLAEVPDAELLVLQDADVHYRGQVVALVVAERLEAAREAAALVDVRVEARTPDVRLRLDHPGLYAPEQVNPTYPTDVSVGDVEPALAGAEHRVDATYSTPALFNNPMEPHATTAWFEHDDLHLVDSTQSTSGTQQAVAQLFGLVPERVHVRGEHVGGGFGSKGSPRPNVPLAVMAAQRTGRAVKLAYTRQMMFSLAGYRTPTVSRIRLGSDDDGRLTAVSHEAFSQTSTLFEFAEQTAEATRHMYATPNLLTTHRLAALDVPTPRWMRAPGECPGMYALESAMDELAVATGIDPVELRIRNDAETDPQTGKPFSSRNLVWCLRRGAERFGWNDRDPRPAVRRHGRWLVGTGVAASVYPAMTMPSGARVVAHPDGRYDVGINASDIGQGARTVLMQIAADALQTDPGRIDLRIADSDLPVASVAGGSSGTASWGWAVVKACDRLTSLRAEGAPVPDDGLEVVVSTEEDIAALPDLERNAYGAQFVEVHVDLDSGEVRVPRMVGCFAAGRIMNARTARSQFIGGMTMGVSMALHEAGEIDTTFGDYANHDFATYHVAAAADAPEIDVEWLDEVDHDLTPLGGKGIGEIGIVGAAAAVANAVWHATGERVRDLPIRPDRLVERLPRR